MLFCFEYWLNHEEFTFNIWFFTFDAHGQRVFLFHTRLEEES